ncbi:MAG: glycosyltransferase family 2 protein [Bacteroidota bacterium]|nr:glycosyltransferase family 2 protein [Bacteroidota bacterium]
MNNNNEIFISVIIPTYNRAHFIKEAINSVLNQTYKNFEIIIIDDGSTDNTREIVNGLQQRDQIIRYFYQENKGRCIARNKGLAEAKFPWICFLDSDDIYTDNHLEVMVDLIKKYPEYYAFATEQQVGDKIKGYISKRLYKKFVKVTFKDFLFSNPISIIQFCYNKDKIPVYFINENVPVSEDWLFFRILTLNNDIIKINTITNIVTLHDERTMYMTDIMGHVKWTLYTGEFFVKNFSINKKLKNVILSETFLLCANILLSNGFKKDGLFYLKKSLVILQTFYNPLLYKAIIKLIVKNNI